MYIEYTPIDLFDEAEQHLQYPPAATTTTGFGVESGGVGGDIGIFQDGDLFFQLKSKRINRKCSEFSKTKSNIINQDYIGVGRSVKHTTSSSSSSSIPMGFDILAAIRKIFGDKGDSLGRKRRADGDWNSTSSQFKYRKVESEFPKYIKKSLEEDEINIVPQRLNKGSLQMAHQNQKEKKSQFVRPKTFTKHITNTNYADIEFSDDDDDEIVYTNSRGEAFNLVRQSVLNRPAVSRPSIISSSSSNKMANIPLKQRQPPPPLIQASTGNIVASSLIPDLQPIRQPNYSSIVSACTNGFDNCTSFTNSIGPKGSTPKERIVPIQMASPFLFNGNTMGFSSLKGARSIIAQENQSKDQEQYRELLQKLIPNLYGIKSTAPKLSGLTKARPAIIRTKDTPCIDLTAKPLRNRKLSAGNILLSVDLSDDDDVSEIIDLADDEIKMLSACSKIQDQLECSYDLKKKAAEKKNQLPYVEPVNSLKEKFDLSPIYQNDWLKNFYTKWGKKRLELKNELAETEKEVEELSAETRHKEKEMQERLKELQIVDPELVVIDDFPEDEVEPEFPELTPEHETIIKTALFGGPADQMLISKFNMSITRRDISTLLGKTWLNDEVINFYMNLLTERGELRHEEGLPKVYAMNTFFVQKLEQSGHSGVRRWTRKVDIFSYDVIPVPVHVGGVHWCMAIIHLRQRSIKYYDSMGTPNPKILSALEQYLREESLDKRKRPFDTSDFLIESVRDVPRQMNGSDCGVFSCMFAEYISRDREITFSQQHMDYFRHKMILEIVQGQLMH